MASPRPTPKKPQAGAKRTPRVKAPGFVIRSLTLTPATDEVLQRVSQDASDFVGRTVSSSAVVRALLRHAEQQGAQWIAARIFPLVEAELSSGVTWGKRK